MNYTISEWQAAYQNLLTSKIPTIVSLFGHSWLQQQSSTFQDSTHQLRSHPLVCLLVNCGGNPSRYCHDAEFLEKVFFILNCDLTVAKIRDIKNRTTWEEFLPIFGELIFAYEMKNGGLSIKILAESKTERKPDIEWTDNCSKIAVEINTVTENDRIRSDRNSYQDDLSDAIKLSRLVHEYRTLKKSGQPLSSEIQQRLEDIEYYDKIWEDPPPRVFGGVPPIRSRFKSSGSTMTDMRGRKKDGEQIAKHEFGILGLVLPTEYFPRPYSFLRIWESEFHEVIYLTTGTVFNSFYGKKGDPIYNHSHDIGGGRKKHFFALEHDKDDGRFMQRSPYSAAVLCSLATSQGRIETPIRYKFFLYEPLGYFNWVKLLPTKIVTNLKKALNPDKAFSKEVARSIHGYMKSTILVESLIRKFQKPTKVNT